MHDPIDEQAELYALGLLEPDDCERIDAHAGTCDLCAVKLGCASLAVTSIVDAARRQTRRRPVWPLAVAAAFAVTSGVALQQNMILHGALANDGLLLDTLVTSHFAHQQFQGPDGKTIDAKAIYERHGEWFEILAAGQPAWSVTLVGRDGSRTRLPSFTRRGTSSIVFARPTHVAESIELQDTAGTVVGSVRPGLATETE